MFKLYCHSSLRSIVMTSSDHWCNIIAVTFIIISLLNTVSASCNNQQKVDYIRNNLEPVCQNALPATLLEKGADLREVDFDLACTTSCLGNYASWLLAECNDPHAANLANISCLESMNLRTRVVSRCRNFFPDVAMSSFLLKPLLVEHFSLQIGSAVSMAAVTHSTNSSTPSAAATSPFITTQRPLPVLLKRAFWLKVINLLSVYFECLNFWKPAGMEWSLELVKETHSPSLLMLIAK